LPVWKLCVYCAMQNTQHTPVKMANSLISSHYEKKEAIRNSRAVGSAYLGMGVSVEYDLSLIMWNVNPSAKCILQIDDVLDTMRDAIDDIWTRFTKQRVRHVNEETSYFKTPESALSFRLEAAAREIRIWGDLYGEDVLIATIRRSRGKSGDNPMFLENPKAPGFTKVAISEIQQRLLSYSSALLEIETAEGRAKEETPAVEAEVVEVTSEVIPAPTPAFTFEDAVEIVTPIEIPAPAPVHGEGATLEEILEPLAAEVETYRQIVEDASARMESHGWGPGYASSTAFRDLCHANEDKHRVTPDVEFEMSDRFGGVARVYQDGKQLGFCRLPDLIHPTLLDAIANAEDFETRAAMTHLEGVEVPVRIRFMKDRTGVQYDDTGMTRITWNTKR
jgi:hypothetical protein